MNFSYKLQNVLQILRRISVALLCHPFTGVAIDNDRSHKSLQIWSKTTTCLSAVAGMDVNYGALKQAGLFNLTLVSLADVLVVQWKM